MAECGLGRRDRNLGSDDAIPLSRRVCDSGHSASVCSSASELPSTCSGLPSEFHSSEDSCTCDTPIHGNRVNDTYTRHSKGCTAGAVERFVNIEGPAKNVSLSCNECNGGYRQPVDRLPADGVSFSGSDSGPICAHNSDRHRRDENQPLILRPHLCVRAAWSWSQRMIFAILAAFEWTSWRIRVYSSKIRGMVRRNVRAIRIILYTSGLLVSSIGNTISFKKMLDIMPNYSCFLTQFNSASYVPIFFSLTLYSYAVGKIPQETMDFPKRNFALMGFLDSLGSVLSIIGGVHTTGTTQVVLNQVGIPFSLIFSTILLQKRYHVLHYFGAFIIIVGVFVVKAPDLLNPSKASVGDILVFNALFLLAGVPFAFSSVYKEVAFRGVSMDINFLQAWVAFFQFFVGFSFLPINSLPILGTQGIALSQLPTNLINGWKCLFWGINSITTDCDDGFTRTCDTCGNAWVSVVSYLACNIVFNVFSVLVLKHCGAALSFLVSTLRLPLTSMAFYSKTIMGDKASSPQLTDFLGLVILLMGLVIYRFGSIHKKKSHIGDVRPEVCESDDDDDDDDDDTEVRGVFSTVVVPEPSHIRMHMNPSEIHAMQDCYHSSPENGSERCSRSSCSDYSPPNILIHSTRDRIETTRPRTPVGQT